MEGKIICRAGRKLYFGTLERKENGNVDMFCFEAVLKDDLRYREPFSVEVNGAVFLADSEGGGGFFRLWNDGGKGESVGGSFICGTVLDSVLSGLARRYDALAVARETREKFFETEPEDEHNYRRNPIIETLEGGEMVNSGIDSGRYFGDIPRHLDGLLFMP